LVKGEANTANDGSDKMGDDQISTSEDKENNSTMIYVLAAICLILLAALLIVAKRNNSEDEPLPRGMPTKAEDAWVSGYINRK
jgi:hypothetical protein